MNFDAAFVEKMAVELKSIRRVSISLRFDLDHLANCLRVPRAKVFLHEGVMRRLGLIEHCLERIFEIFPPEREAVLGKGEQNDVIVNIHAFVINVYGILDNMAWVCALENGFPDPDANKMKIGLFNKALRPHLPPDFDAYLQGKTMQAWFTSYAKIYRDATAHRIAPYLPPKGLTDAEAAKYWELDVAALAALKGHHFEQMEALHKERDAIGRPLALIALSVSGTESDNRPFPLHPQILCDILTVHEALSNFAKGLREQHGLPKWPLRGLLVI